MEEREEGLKNQISQGYKKTYRFNKAIPIGAHRDGITKPERIHEIDLDFLHRYNRCVPCSFRGNPNSGTRGCLTVADFRSLSPNWAALSSLNKKKDAPSTQQLDIPRQCMRGLCFSGLK